MASTSPDPNSPDDTNVEPVPASTTISSTLPVHTSSHGRLFHGASTGAKKIACMVGWPGVSEVREMMRDLVQNPDDKRVEIAKLNAYAKNVLITARSDYSSLQKALAESTSEIEVTQRQIDELEHDRKHMSAERARRRQEELELRSREVDCLVNQRMNIRLEMLNMRAEVGQLDPNACLGTLSEEEDDKIPEDKFPLIDLDMILDEEEEPSYMAVDRKNLFDKDPCELICIAEDQALVTCTTGFLNGVRVVRKSYNSSDKAIATRFFKKDLMSLTRYHHRNVASLKGVIRDFDGKIREIVMTTAPLSHQAFLERVVDPVSLALFMKGHLSIGAVYTPKDERLEDCKYPLGCILWATSPKRLRQGWMKGGVQLQVDYNGHVTAVPAEGMVETVRIILMVVSYHSRGAVNPLVKDILRIYCRQVLCWLDPLNQPGLRGFIDRVSHLELHRTLLDVLKIAADTGIGPLRLMSMHSANEPPSVTFSAGEIGVMKDKHFVKMLKEQPWTAERAQVFDFWYAGTTCLQTKGWRSSALGPNTMILSWSERATPQTWESIRSRANHLAKLHNTALSELGQVDSLVVFLIIRHTKNMHKIVDEDTLPSDAAEEYCDKRMCSLKTSNRLHPLYFHRRPTSRDCPREYWGFISTSPDPYGQCPEFPIGTDRVWYDAFYNFYRMDQDYRICYDKMVEDGLQTMPGSFGG